MRVDVLGLIPALLAACGADTGGPCPESATREEAVEIDAAAFEMALDEDGNLSAQACQQLCVDAGLVSEDIFLEWVECRDDGPGAQGEQLFCSWRERVYCIGGRASACVGSRSEGFGRSAVAAWLAGTTHAEAAAVRSARTSAARQLVAGLAEPPRDLTTDAGLPGLAVQRRLAAGVRALA